MGKKYMKNYNEKPLLSVIVPVYNVEEFVEECLYSIINQDYTNLEVIVVNDGSTDKSFDFIKSFAQQHSCVTVYDKPNGGLSDTRNYALDRCNGDYITFIDSDDVLLNKDIYSKIIDKFEEDKTLDAIQFDLVYKWQSSEEHKRNYPFRDYIGKEELLTGYLRQWIHVSCCDKVFRRTVFDNIRFPKGEISEDIAIIPQLVTAIGKMAVTDIGDYGYRHREGSITTAVPKISKIFSILNSYNKYLSCCMAFSSIRLLAMDCYTKQLWGYTSIIRQYHYDNLSDYYKQHFFQKISFGMWIKYHDRSLSANDKLKSFIACVMGPKWIVRFQKKFTRNE